MPRGAEKELYQYEPPYTSFIGAVALLEQYILSPVYPGDSISLVESIRGQDILSAQVKRREIAICP